VWADPLGIRGGPRRSAPDINCNVKSNYLSLIGTHLIGDIWKLRL
jgi:hypothetical protein